MYVLNASGGVEFLQVGLLNPSQVHQRCINSWMARKGVRQFGAYASSSQTMSQWVQKQSFSTQHRIGVNLLRHCGVHI